MILNHPIILATAACVLLQLCAFFYQLKTKHADSVDMAWAWGIVIVAIIYQLTLTADISNRLMVMIFPIIWYGRLGWHLVARYDGEQEDSRYRHLRNHWSKNTQGKFFVFFMFQAGLSILFSLPAYWLLTSGALAVWQMVAAVLIGGGAFIGESLADRQLHRFKKSHDSSEVCNVGLWRYSRHPNYFFEWLHWFVYPILLWHSAYFWYALGMVALMLLFLLKLTGIPFSEQQALKKRGLAYKRYQQKTNKFFIGPVNDDF
ncbi:MAG: DUF1295 domain-containing protein [Marinicella pacifica]